MPHKEESSKALKMLLVMLHPGYIRNYESVLRTLIEHGHRIHVEFNQPRKQADDRQSEFLAKEFPGRFTIAETQFPKRKDIWGALTRVVYGGMDYLRYFHPDYENARTLRERVEVRLGLIFGPLLSVFLFLARGFGVKVLGQFLATMASAIPSDESLNAYIHKQEPDLIMITPLVNIASDQTDVIKSAKALGIRCALCVASWDNLTNKGLIRIDPGLILLWNEFQKKEAIRFHGMGSSELVVTGAQCYDKWFDRSPSTEKNEFLGKVGLPHDKPYLLYLCSSPFIAPEEVSFVQDWIEKIRASENPNIRNMSILVRPHPQNAGQWATADLSPFGDAAVYPRAGANPVTADSRADFFDSMYHSSAVAGVNTSAMIESGIVGRPVLTIRDERFRETQDGTLHFQYLVNGGLLDISETFDEHLSQLGEALADSEARRERIAGFIRDFVRPHGLGTPCTPIIVNALEKHALRGKVAPEVVPLRHKLLRILALPIAVFLRVALRFRKKRVAATRRATSGAANATANPVLPRASRKGTQTKAKTDYTLPKPLRLAKPVLLPMARFVRRRPLMRRHVVPWLVKEELGASTSASEIKQIQAEIKRAVKGPNPILVGPWISEVGFELLYWIPFLRWVMKRHKISPERLVVVSRGGAQPWYEGICGKYVDAFEFYTQDEYRKKNEERIAGAGTQKHNEIYAFDEEIMEQIQRSLGIEEFCWLHPSYMYRLFRLYWVMRCPISLIDAHTEYETRDKAGLPMELLNRLPETFVAVKLYFSACFPETPENKKVAANLLGSLSQESHVVLLSTGLNLDDHSDFVGINQERVHDISNLVTPENNLAVQTAIVAKAQAFYGTYGGFSYLAPIYGVPSVALFSHEDQFLPVHLDVAYRASRVMKFGYFGKVKAPLLGHEGRKGKDSHDFIAMNVRNLPLLGQLSRVDPTDASVVQQPTRGTQPSPERLPPLEPVPAGRQRGPDPAGA